MFLLIERSRLLRHGISVLDLTPEPGVVARIKPFAEEYIRWNLGSEPIPADDRRLDLFAKNPVNFQKRFDLILHNHVIDKIPHPISRILSSLAGYLKGSGYMLFSIPIRLRANTSETIGAPISDRERKQLYGREDRVRMFGANDVEQLFYDIFGNRISVAYPEDFLSDQDFHSFGIPKPSGVDANTIFVVAGSEGPMHNSAA